MYYAGMQLFRVSAVKKKISATKKIRGFTAFSKIKKIAL